MSRGVQSPTPAPNRRRESSRAATRRARGISRSIVVAAGLSDRSASRLLGVDLDVPLGVDLETIRPRLRGECVGAARPCPWFGCRHHLGLDVTETGGIKLNFPTLELDELDESCSLDAADRGVLVLDRVGELMNLTRERVRQVETRGLANMKRRGGSLAGDEGSGA